MSTPITSAQSIRNGLTINGSLLAFDFKPSIGIGAAKIDKLGLDIRSFKEPLTRVVQQVMAPSFAKNFVAGGRPDKWQELSEGTMQHRERASISGDQPLIRTGLLAKTMAQLNIWTITTTTATIQDLPSKIWYGKVQQPGYKGAGSGRSMQHYTKKAKGDARLAAQMHGDDIHAAERSGKPMYQGKKNVAQIVPRPFALVQDEDFIEIQKIFVKWLDERILKAGLL